MFIKSKLQEREYLRSQLIEVLLLEVPKELEKIRTRSLQHCHKLSWEKYHSLESRRNSGFSGSGRFGILFCFRISCGKSKLMLLSPLKNKS